MTRPADPPSFAPLADVSMLDSTRRTLFRDQQWLLTWTAVFALIYLAFYPGLYTSIDEASTFRMAFALRHGWLVPHDAGFFPSISPIGPHGRMYRFPIGFPAVLAVVSYAGWRAMFLVNPLLHLLAAWCFGRVLYTVRLPTKFTILYLFYPCLVLFTRTLFSDAFAASLTTIALFFLICRRAPLSAGLCLGLALTARAASAPVAALLFLALLCRDWRFPARSLRNGKAIKFGLGLIPFLLANSLYNDYTMGSPLRSPYSVQQLSLHGLVHMGPLYALSLLLIFPGMLLAPALYRGVFWKTGLAATTLIFFLAASYDESTYGNNALQTLLSTPRQLMPVMPFYLLAYCGMLAKWLPEAQLRRIRAFDVAAVLLLAAAVGISALHQKYLQSLAMIQTQVAAALPARCILYANKDVYKLYQPQWDTRTCRELPFVSNDQVAVDLRTGPVFVVLFIRSRGFAAEDADNAALLADMRARFILTPVALSGGGSLRGYRVTKVRALLSGVSSDRRPMSVKDSNVSQDFDTDNEVLKSQLASRSVPTVT